MKLQTGMYVTFPKEYKELSPNLNVLYSKWVQVGLPVLELKHDKGFYPYEIRGFHNDQDSERDLIGKDTI